MKRKLLIWCISLLIIGAAAVLLVSYQGGSDDYPELVDERQLSVLPVEDRSGIDTSYLDDSLTAPTNKWFSGLALQEKPQAVFPTPLSFRSFDNSFEVGLPDVSVSSDLILGQHTAGIRAEIQDASSYQVTRYDEMSADLEYTDGEEALGTVTVTAGSPYVFFAAQRDTVLLFSGGTINAEGTHISITADGKTFTVAAFDGASFSEDGNNIKAFVPEGAHLSFYAADEGGTNTLDKYAGNRVTGASVSYKKTTSAYQTSLSITTANNQPTVLGIMPHQHSDMQTTNLTYQTIYGSLKTAAGLKFTFTTPEIGVRTSLKTSSIDDRDKTQLIKTLRRDINATNLDAHDSYFGGKELYRAAQLLDLAHQLGETQLANLMQRKLSAEFNAWFSADSQSGQYFYYDDRLKGIVGVTPAFGSESFNDHHFHYGYFIYAAALLGKYDETFMERHAGSVNLLVADIANYRNGEDLPLRRHLDPFFGHSWASGAAPFNDGNNQESSSEAINAWVATALWARQTGNDKLREQAAWMLSNESAAADAYWLHFDRAAPPYSRGYKQSVVALNWGGKREYATFFSDSPSAMLGIQLIPMNPTMSQIRAPASRLQQNTEAALSLNSYNQQFGDYILMYQAAAGTATAPIRTANELPAEYIDGANSRSYLLAWMLSVSQTD